MADAHNFVDMSMSDDRRRLRESKLRDDDSLEASFDSLGGVEDEEILACDDTGGSVSDREFDEIVAALQDILMDPSFVELQATFCQRHCGVFEDTEENKLEYTPIFEKYTGTIEGWIERTLKERLPNFDMDRFVGMCEEREGEVTGDVFDLLLSCGDFQEFKVLMLSHKRQVDFGLDQKRQRPGPR